MKTPDTDDDKLLEDQSVAESANDQQDQTLDDNSERPSGDSETLENDGDDADAISSDPLVLAMADEDTEEKQEPPKKAQDPATKPKQPATKAATDKSADKAAKPTDNSKEETEDEDVVALAKMPDDDWQKLSHKAKSQFLIQQKLIKSAKSELKTERESAKAIKADYEAVESFRANVRLTTREFATAAHLGSAIKHGSKDVIPFLESTLANIRQMHGIEVAPEPAAPQIDVDELAELVNGARNYDLDAIGRLDQLVGRLKSSAPAKKSQKPPAAPDAKVESNQRNQNQQQQHSRDAEVEQSEYQAIFDALVGAGVQEDQVAEHVRGLISEVVHVPVGQRLRAVMRVHHERIKKTTDAPRERSSAPMSGRTSLGRRVAPVDSQQPKDPLKIAFQGRSG